MSCFVCQPKTKASRDRRAACVERGEHRPAGPAVVHECFAGTGVLRVCRDCRSVVVDVG